jgi:hypothetical protein
VMLHQFAPLLPLAVAPLFSGLAIWSALRMRAVHRKRGRQQVERLLASRGEALVAIKTVRISPFRPTAGLSAAEIFEVHARRADGEEQVYEWAYEPRVFPWQTEGLKRLAHGIWIAA